MQEERDDRPIKEMKEHEDRRDKKQTRELSKILATVANQTRPEAGRSDRMENRMRPRMDKDQCAYCKEKGHWVKDCPKRPRNPRKQPAQLLALDED